MSVSEINVWVYLQTKNKDVGGECWSTKFKYLSMIISLTILFSSDMFFVYFKIIGKMLSFFLSLKVSGLAKERHLLYGRFLKTNPRTPWCFKRHENPSNISIYKCNRTIYHLKL